MSQATETPAPARPWTPAEVAACRAAHPDMETDAEAVHHLSHCRVVDLAVDVSEDVQVSDHDPETLDRWAGQLAALLAEIRAANG